MAASASNLIAGPGTLFIADFGTTEPDDSDISSTLSASGWTDIGATQDGVTLTWENEWFELEMDQVIDVPARRQTKRDLRVVTNMAEPTLDNLEITLNGGTVTASASYSTYEPDSSSTSNAPTYKALLFEGTAPGGFRRWLIVRKTLQVENMETAYQKGAQTLFPVSFAAHYVSAGIRPFKVIDQTS